MASHAGVSAPRSNMPRWVTTGGIEDGTVHDLDAVRCLSLSIAMLANDPPAASAPSFVKASATSNGVTARGERRHQAPEGLFVCDHFEADTLVVVHSGFSEGETAHRPLVRFDRKASSRSKVVLLINGRTWSERPGSLLLIRGVPPEHVDTISCRP